MRRFPAAAIALALVCASSWPAGSGAQTEARIGVEKYKTEKTPIWIQRTGAGNADGRSAALADEAFEVLKSDMDRSGFFRIAEAPADSLIDPGATLAAALVKSQVGAADGRVTLEGSLLNLPSLQVIMRKGYRGGDDALRRIVHRLSDEIVKYLTGEEGIARTQIGFVRRAGGIEEIYIMDYDGHGVQRVTDERALVISPAWSPDGRRMSYTSYRSGNPDLYVLDLDARITLGHPGLRLGQTQLRQLEKHGAHRILVDRIVALLRHRPGSVAAVDGERPLGGLHRKLGDRIELVLQPADHRALIPDRLRGGILPGERDRGRNHRHRGNDAQSHKIFRRHG